MYPITLEGFFFDDLKIDLHNYYSHFQKNFFLYDMFLVTFEKNIFI